jgi:hypothetical protein
VFTTNWVTRSAEAWGDFWFTKGPPTALGLFRILFGLYWLVPWLLWTPHVELYFSGEGMHFPFYPTPTSGVHSVSDLIGWMTSPATPGLAWALYLATFVPILMIIAGYRTRLALVLFFGSFLYHYYLQLHMFGTSFHRLLILVNAVLILSPCGKALSLDAWRARRRGKPEANEVELWTQRVICVQIAILYFATGVHKIVTPAWNNGDNLASALIGEYGTALGFWVARLPITTPGTYDLLTLSVILFELVIPFALFHPRWQKPFFVFGALFHLVNATLLDIPQFAIVVMTYVLFLDPREARDWIERGANVLLARSGRGAGRAD